MTTHVRLATGDDAEGILRIYAPVVRDTTTSFEIEIPTVDEMRRRVVSTLSHLPWLVAESDSRVVGYRNVGYKDGTWCDVGWWQRDLQVYDGEPAPLRALAEIA